MTDSAAPDATSDPGFFEGRLMIDILAWDWNLRIAVSPALARPKARFQGLDYGRDFTLRGRVRGPNELRGKGIKVTLSPFGAKVRFGPRGLQHVGSIMAMPAGSAFDLEAVLMLPEEAIASTATSLSATWKYLQIQTTDDDLNGARVFFYSFHASIPPKLKAWANAD